MSFKRLSVVSLFLLSLAVAGTVQAAESPDLRDVEKARQLMEAKKPGEALGLLEQVLARNPSYVPAYFHRGMALIQTEEYDRALSNFNKAVEINPKFAQAYLGRSMVYFLKHDLDACIADLGRVLDLEPQLAAAYYNRGVAYAYQEKFDKAFEDLSKAKSLGYAVEEELLQQAWSLSHPERVVDEATKEIGKNPKNGQAFYNRAVARYYLKDYQAALEDLNKAGNLGVTVDPGMIENIQEHLKG